MVEANSNVRDAVELLTGTFPDLVDESKAFVEGVLQTSLEDFEIPDDLNEAIGPIVLELADENYAVENWSELCTKVFITLKGNEAIISKKRLQKLDTARSMKDSFADSSMKNDFRSWNNSRSSKENPAEQKRLEKAEAKLSKKQDARGATLYSHAARSSTSKAISSSQAVSRRNRVPVSETVRDIKLDNFDMAFQDNKLLNNACLTLAYGRRYGLVGRNGIGKSTLLKLIAMRQLYIPDHISILFVEQEIQADSRTVLEAVLESDVKRERLLKEERELKVKSDTVSTTRLNAVYEELLKIDADAAPARAALVLYGLGFSQDMQIRETKTYSGGWRMRVALASALFAKPDLLLLDEPTNYLDLKTIMWLEQYLQTWPSTILIVSHDRKFLNNIVTDIVHFYQRKLTSYRGDFMNYVAVKGEKLKAQHRAYEAQQAEIAHIQEFIDKFRFKAGRASLVQSKIKMLERMEKIPPIISETGIKFHFPEIEKLSSSAINAQDMCFKYPGSDNLVFDKVNISCSADSRVVIVGDNGAGKTTFLKLFLGQLEATKGFVTRERRLRIGYFSQHHVDMLDMDKSALQFIESTYPGQREGDYRSALGNFCLPSEKQTQPLATLSGGEKTRVALAIMAFKSPNFLIFDEVSNHLDTETVEALAQALKEFKGGVMIVSHDEYLVELVCNDLWLCGDGDVKIIKGGYEEYMIMIRKQLEELAGKKPS